MIFETFLLSFPFSLVLTRNQVAQMALNALQSNMVRFTGTPGITVGDATIGYRPEYTFRTSTEQKYNALVQNKTDIALQGQYYIQLGEELYDGKLTKRFARDDFERPGYNWQFDGKDIGTYVDYTLKRAEYTEGVSGEELYDLLTYTTINENDLLRYVDGETKTLAKSRLARSVKNDVDTFVGNGVLTEVFVDDLRDEITISSISTWLAKANSDYNTSTETLSLSVYYTDSKGRTFTVDGEDVPAAENVKKDDFVLVNISLKESITNPEVVKIGTPEILTDASITKFSQSSGSDQTKGFFTKLTTGGTEYEASEKAEYSDDVLNLYDDGLLTDNTYNVYLDKYGYAVGVDLYEGTKNYVFISGYDRGTSHISIKTADAAAIFLDGTMQVITVNVTDTNKNIDRMNNNVNDGGASGDPYFVQWSGDGKVAENRWYTYTVANNGVYTLRPVANMFATNYAPYTSYNNNTRTLDSANLYVDDNGMPGSNKGRAYGEDASIYITVDTGRVDMSASDNDAITDVKGVYTGIQDIKMELTANTQKNVPNAVYTVYDSDRYIIASIVLGEAQGGAANYAYILSGAKSERIEREGDTRASGDVTYYWEFDAVLNGEKQTLTARTKYPSASMITRYTVQELRFDGEYVTDVKPVELTRIHTSNKTNNRIEDMYVYDVGQVNGVDWASNTVGILDNTGVDLDNPDILALDGAPANHRIDGTIYLQGRTLYSESGDVGLALARDAKAVVVQMEDGDREVTNCASVADAIARLADRNGTTAGVQFKGRIVAVLDTRGIAQWVVLISDTELVTGSNPNYGQNQRGNVIMSETFAETKLLDSVTGNTYISAYGQPVMSFTANTPDWAAGTATFTYNVFVNNQFMLTSSTSALAIDADQNATQGFVVVGGITGGILEPNSIVRVEITGVTYSARHVRYFYRPDTATAATEIPASDLGTGTTTTIATGNQNTFNIGVKNTFQGTLAANGAGVLTFTGATLAQADTVSRNIPVDGTSINVVDTGDNIVVSTTNNNYVDVLITGLSKAPNAYAVTAHGAASYTATLETIGVTGLPSADSKGKNVVLTVTPGAASIGDGANAVWTIELRQSGGSVDGIDGLVYGYEVSYSINGVPQGVRKMDFKGGATVSNVVTVIDPRAAQNLVITGVKALTINNPYAVSATLSSDGTTLTITYSAALETSVDTSTGHVTVTGDTLGTASVAGNKLIITVTGALEENDTVNVDAAVKDANGTMFAKETTITVPAKPATGDWTCTINNAG